MNYKVKMILPLITFAVLIPQILSFLSNHYPKAQAKAITEIALKNSSNENIPVTTPIIKIIQEPKEIPDKQSQVQQRIQVIPAVPQLRILPTVMKPQPVLYPMYSIDYIRQRICEVFGSQCRNALIIAQRESGFNPRAVSPTADFGVMQINCPSHASKVGGDCTRFFDLETNLRVAKMIYDASGWRPWTTSKYL